MSCVYSGNVMPNGIRTGISIKSSFLIVPNSQEETQEGFLVDCKHILWRIFVIKFPPMPWHNLQSPERLFETAQANLTLVNRSEAVRVGSRAHWEFRWVRRRQMSIKKYAEER